ncbi:hypothetical protein [Streptomyces sp. NBC_00366]|uniref:hypothetical protein n=1 Tax=Streptomyces sp. NBC_00366 TaxID=2975727 RepID=UPI002E260B2D
MLVVGVAGQVADRALARAPAVGDVRGAERDRRVLRLAEIVDGRSIGLDQEDATERAGGADHVEVEAYLAGPARVGLWVVGAAALVGLAEAAVGGGAGRQAELGAVDGQVGLGVRVVVGVDDSNRSPGPGRVRRQVVGALKVSGA